MYVCLCHGITERLVRAAIDGGARDVAAIGRATRAGTDCGQCRPALEALLVPRHEPTNGGTHGSQRTDRRAPQ